MGVKLPFPQEPKKLLSAPYHGLYKGYTTGKLKLGNGTEIDWPGPGGGSTVLLRIPGLPAIVRSPAEAAADIAAGIEYRDYALLSGGQYGKMAPIASAASDATAATWVYIDQTKARWLIRLRCNVSGGSGAYLFKVRRYLHIDGTEVAWSAEKPVTLSPQYWPYRVCETMCQNSTGSEVVVHNAGTFGWPDAIMKVLISGTVNLSAADFGLGFAFANIEWPGRVCGSWANGMTVSGKLYSRIDYHYEERIGGVPTGQTLDAYMAYEDKVLVHDDRPNPLGNWTLVNQSQEVFSSDKAITHYDTISRVRYVWGAYHNDNLRLLRGEYLSDTTWIASIFNGPNSWSGPSNYTQYMRWYYGATLIKEQLLTSSASQTEIYYPDGYAEIRPTTNYTSIDFKFDDGKQWVGSSPSYHVWYEPDRVSGVSDRIGNAAVKIVEKKYYPATSTSVSTCQSLHAPDGNTIPYVLPLGVGSQVQATWHPVTGVIEASQDPVICWF